MVQKKQNRLFFTISCLSYKEFSWILSDPLFSKLFLAKEAGQDPRNLKRFFEIQGVSKEIVDLTKKVIL